MTTVATAIIAANRPQLMPIFCSCRSIHCSGFLEGATRSAHGPAACIACTRRLPDHLTAHKMFQAFGREVRFRGQADGFQYPTRSVVMTSVWMEPAPADRVSAECLVPGSAMLLTRRIVVPLRFGASFRRQRNENTKQGAAVLQVLCVSPATV